MLKLVLELSYCLKEFVLEFVFGIVHIDLLLSSARSLESGFDTQKDCNSSSCLKGVIAPGSWWLCNSGDVLFHGID